MLEALRKKRAAKAARMREIVAKAEAEDRDLSQEEKTEFDECDAAVAELKTEIERLERLEAIEVDLDAPLPTAAARGQRPAPRGPEAATEFETFGQFIHAVRFNPNDQRLDFHEEVGAPNRQGAMEMETGQSGGYMVPTQFRSQLMSVSPSEAYVRPRATVIPAGSPPDSAISMPALDQSGTSGPANMYGGVTVTWISEGTTKPETDMDLREITLTPHEVAAHIVLSDKLLRNWQAADAVVGSQLRGAMMAAEDTAFLRGTGAGQPLGIINSAAAYLVNRGVATTFKYPDVEAMLARLLMRGGSPAWSINQQVMPQLTSMRNLSADSPPLGDGALIWQQNARDSAGMQNLMGYQIKWNERAPALGSLGDVVLADLSQYLIKDGSGPFVQASEHVYFTSNKTVIKAFWNVDGKPWLSSTLNLENDYDVSPFVVLTVPA